MNEKEHNYILEGRFRPFDMQQLLLVYDIRTNAIVEMNYFKADEVADAVLNYKEKYDIVKASFRGARSYVAGIAQQILDAELLKYNNHNLEITIE